MGLLDKKCIPCEGGVPPLEHEAKLKLLDELGERWSLVDNGTKLECSLSLPEFTGPMALANTIAKLADEQWHHPDLHISFGRIKIQIWTHKIDELVESDFIFAAKVNKIIDDEKF